MRCACAPQSCALYAPTLLGRPSIQQTRHAAIIGHCANLGVGCNVSRASRRACVQGFAGESANDVHPLARGAYWPHAPLRINQRIRRARLHASNALWGRSKDTQACEAPVALAVCQRAIAPLVHLAAAQIASYQGRGDGPLLAADPARGRALHASTRSWNSEGGGDLRSEVFSIYPTADARDFFGRDGLQKQVQGPQAECWPVEEAPRTARSSGGRS